MTNPTYLEKLMQETLRPIYGAMELLHQEITETLQIPNSPWQILNKPYDQLTEQEIITLLDIYHQDQEQEPCPMCKWLSRVELQKRRANQRDGLEKLDPGYHRMPNGDLMRNRDMEGEEYAK